MKIIHFFVFVLLISSFSVAAAETLRVKGVVTDTKGETLIGVSVVVKNGSAGTITNIDGQYTLSASAGSVLVFSYVGYDTQEVQLRAGQQVVNVVLQESVQIIYY